MEIEIFKGIPLCASSQKLYTNRDHDTRVFLTVDISFGVDIFYLYEFYLRNSFSKSLKFLLKILEISSCPIFIKKIKKKITFVRGQMEKPFFAFVMMEHATVDIFKFESLRKKKGKHQKYPF